MRNVCEEQSEVGATPNLEEEQSEVGATPTSEEITLAEAKVVECLIILDRADNEHGRAGLEFGRALIVVREKKKAAGDRDWMAFLDLARISRDKARHWMAKAEGKPTDRHAKKEAKAESQSAQPKNTLASWERIAGELKVVVDHALILQNSQPVSEPSRTQLANLAKQVLELAEGADNA
jgi:hypothetical protein